MSSRPWAVAVAVAATMLAGACAAPSRAPRAAAAPGGAIGGASSAAASSPGAKRATGIVRGRVAPTLVAYLDDEPLAVPAADVALDAPADLRVGGSPTLWAAPPLAGYVGERPAFALRYQGPAELPARRWSLHLSRYDNGRAVRTLGAAGAPPPRIEWDGLDDRGDPVPANSVLLAQLDVRSVGGAGAASPRIPFGLAVAGGPERRERTVPGAPFDSAGKPSPALARLIDDIASAAVPGSKVSLEVHADGTGDRLTTIARTQRESQQIAALLHSAGVPDRIVEARGRGSLEPLEAPTSAETRRRNRRVVAVVEVPRREVATAAQAPPSAAAPVPAGASLSGVPLRVQRDGSFSFPVPPVVREAVLQLRATDGRRASTPVGRGGEQSELVAGPGASREVEVVADTRAGTVTVDGDTMPPGWARVRVELARSRAGGVAFALRVPGELSVRSWRLRIAALDSGKSRGAGGDRAGADQKVERTVRADGSPPRVWVWDGRDEKGRPRLEPGSRFRVVLEVRGRDGTTGWSPAYDLVVPPSRWRGLALDEERLFRGARPSSRLKTFLSRFAAVARRRTGRAFSLRLQVAVDRDTVAERRLGLAARTAAVRKYLARLRVPERRYDLHGDLADGRDGRGRLRIGERARPPALRAPRGAEPQVAIDGRRQKLDRAGRAASRLELAGGTVVIEVLRPGGHRARYSLRR